MHQNPRLKYGYHSYRLLELLSWPFLARWITAVRIYHIYISPQTSFNSGSDHWQDVLTGSILGTVLAYFSYRHYYPNLTSKHSHQPYSPRIKREDTEILPTHNLRSSEASHGGGDRTSYADNDNGVAGTVPRPDTTGHLEAVWTERNDEVNTANDNRKDSQSSNGIKNAGFGMTVLNGPEH